MLGSLAGVVGSLGAVALTWGVSRYALEIPWRVFAGEHIGGVVLTAVLVAAIGVLSSLDVLRQQAARDTSSGIAQALVSCQLPRTALRADRSRHHRAHRGAGRPDDVPDDGLHHLRAAGGARARPAWISARC